MKKSLIIVFALILFLPGFIFSDLVSFKVGFYIPHASSDLWTEEFNNMSYSKTDFMNTNFAFGYEYFMSREISLILNIDSYQKNRSGIYNDFVGETIDDWDYAFDYGQGFPISHIFSVSTTPIQASIKFTPFGRKGKIIPYVGGGAGAYLWTVRIQGDLIDFAAGEEFIDQDLNATVIGYPLYPVDAREENRIHFGFHVFGGVMLPIANRISLEGEFKYSNAKGNLKNAFIGFEPFDLGGMTFGIGLNYWF